MFNETDFLTRLQNGETAEDIAASISAALNEAEKTYNAQLEAERAAKEAKEAQTNKVKAHAQKVANAVNEMIDECYSEYASNPITADEVLEIVESVVKISDSLNKFLDIKPVQKVKVVTDNADAHIYKFLEDMGLLH